MGRNNFLKSMSDAYNLTNQIGLDYKLSQAGKADQETINTPERSVNPQMSEAPITTAEDADARIAANPMAPQMNMAPGVGLQPLNAPASTRYKLGNVEQDTPFNQRQVDAYRLGKQGEVYSSFGLSDKAAATQGLAKVAREEGIDESAKSEAKAGLERDFADFKGKDRDWKQISLLANSYLEKGQFDKYAAMAKSAEGLQQDLMNREMDRADLITDPQARISALVDAHGKYVLDGKHGYAVKQNGDGTFKVENEDGSALLDNISPDPKSPRSIDVLSRQLRNPEVVRKLQIEEIQKRQDSKIKDESKLTQSEIKKNEGAANHYNAEAEFARGPRTEVAMARANGAGNGLGQQRFDEKAIQQHINEGADYYTLTGIDGKPMQNVDVKSAYANLVRSMGPDQADTLVWQVRAKAEQLSKDQNGNLDPVKFAAKYTDGMKAVRGYGQVTPQPQVAQAQQSSQPVQQQAVPKQASRVAAVAGLQPVREKVESATAADFERNRQAREALRQRNAAQVSSALSDRAARNKETLDNIDRFNSAFARRSQ